MLDCLVHFFFLNLLWNVSLFPPVWRNLVGWDGPNGQFISR